MKTTITNVVRTFLIASVLTVGFGLLPISSAFAVNPIAPIDINKTTSGYNKADPTTLAGGDFTKVDPYATVVMIINFVLGFLGIIAVIIILLAGFKWMTAAGNEDKVKEAQTMLIQGVIGLVIILAAWGIAQYAFTLPSEIIR